MGLARAVTTSAPRRAAIYLRISDDREGAGLGVARQEEDCRALAKRRGWPIAQVYTDNDVSAYSGKVRPAYRAMLADMKSGAIDGVVAYHVDRLYRQPRELEEFIDLADSVGIRHLATVTGDVDLSTHDGRFQARILGAVARKESDDKSRRIRRKHEQLAQMGRISGGGDRPFGYEDDRLTIRAAEARLIRDGGRRILAGQSLRSVVRLWNGAGSKTTAGRSWYTSAVRRVLISARISGRRELHHEVIGKATWPAIISSADSDRLRAVLSDPSRRKNINARRYLLAGFGRCGLCGARLHARPREDKRRCYVCASDQGGCGKIRILADPLEGFVSQLAIERLATPALTMALRQVEQQPGRDGEASETRRIEDDLQKVAGDFAAGKITRREWLTIRDGLQARLDAIRGRIRREQRTAALDQYVGKSGALATRWPGLTLDERRAVLGAILDRVQIGSAVRGRNRFDATRVQPTWRF